MLGVGLVLEMGEDPFPVGAGDPVVAVLVRKVDRLFIVDKPELGLGYLFCNLFLE